MTTTYIASECYSVNKPDSNGYVQKVVWDKEAKKYRNWKMHRWVYTQTFGEIPEGYEIDHICHNEALAKGECQGGTSCPHRACYNPEHLRAVPKSVNQRDGAAGFGNRKTCKSRGHALTADNIYTYTRKGVQQQTCWSCKRINSAANARKARARKKAQA